MAISIASATQSAAPGSFPAKSTGGLEAELAQYRKQLSECVTCATANTPEGRREIQRIENQIRAITTRIEAARQPKTGSDATATPREATGLGDNVDVFA
jgi:hypothetical protein